MENKPKVQLTAKTLKELREKWAKEQDYLCPILGIDLKEVSVLDHWHSSKRDNTSEDCFKGCCRGVIHKRVNAFEGKVVNNYIRLGLKNLIDLPSLLRNLANYYEENRLHTEDILYIHPSEKPKEPILTKTSYNNLKKAILEGNFMKDMKKLPQYKDKKQKLTKTLEQLFKKYNIEVTYYK
jgi:hypothetical protein